MSLAQIGEFSFIIATLGMSLKVTSDFLYPIVIAVSAVTTFTTPYLIRYSEPIYNWIESKLPQKFLDMLKRYEVAMATSTKEGALSLIWRSYGFQILSNTVIVIALVTTGKFFLFPRFLEIFDNPRAVEFLMTASTLAVCSPFLWAITLKTSAKLSSEGIENLARLKSLQIGIIFTRIIIGILLIVFIINSYFVAKITSLIFLAILIAPIFLFKKKIQSVYLSLERRFLNNLNARELAAINRLAAKPALAPWDVNHSEFVLSQNSSLVGKTLAESRFRAEVGAT